MSPGSSLTCLLLAACLGIGGAVHRPSTSETGKLRHGATARPSTPGILRREVVVDPVGKSALVEGRVLLDEVEEVPGPYFDLLIVIPVNARKQGKRHVIRRTWGQYINGTGHCPSCQSTRTTKLLFGVGAALNETEAAKLEAEKSEFQDIAALPSLGVGEDHYHNLTAKVRSCLKYAVQNFRFELLLKADSDSFVFLDRLLDFAEKKDMFRSHGDKRPPIYAGGFMEAAKPDESTSGKWADRDYRSLTGHQFFPKYARGAGYMLSPSLCRYIADQEDAPIPAEVPDSEEGWVALPSLQQLANEDVSVGFWVQPIVHEKVEMPVSQVPAGCRDASQVIDHHVLPKLMVLRWQTVLATGSPCKTSDVMREEDFEELVAKQLDTMASTV